MYDTETQAQEDFYNNLNASEQRQDNRQPEEGRMYVHKYDPSIKIQLINTTARGWKVIQFDANNPNGSKRRTPKRKTAYYDDADIKHTFKTI